MSEQYLPADEVSRIVATAVAAEARREFDLDSLEVWHRPEFKVMPAVSVVLVVDSFVPGLARYVAAVGEALASARDTHDVGLVVNAHTELTRNIDRDDLKVHKWMPLYMVDIERTDDRPPKQEALAI